MVPEWLEWTDVVLSAIAFGVGFVTLPTAFQMWWGKPAIAVQFDTDRRETGAYLKCYIYNDYVKNRALKLLGVRREPAHEVAGTVTIREHPTGKVIGQARLRLNVEKGGSSVRADIHVGLPAIAVIVYYEKNDGGARLRDHEEGVEDQLIGQGEYEAALDIHWGQHSIRRKKLFFVGQNDERTNWRT